MQAEIEGRRRLLREHPRPAVEQWLEATPKKTLDLVASFQRTVIEELFRRAAAAVEQTEARALVISSGVACNSGLRAAAAELALGVPVFFPTPGLSTDNAAMIAAAGFEKWKRGERSELSLAACANLSLTAPRQS